MTRKLTFLCALLFCYNTTFAQHMEFDGIPFENSLEDIDAELVKRSFLLVEQKYDEHSGGMLFYSGIYSNVKLSVFVRFTPYSRKVYTIKVLYDRKNYDKIKEYLERVYDVKPVESHLKINYTPTDSDRFIYDIDGKGWIGLNNERTDIFDNEFHCLYKAEVYYPKFVKKRDLRRWQKKYNNPLFYDKNPVVK